MSDETQVIAQAVSAPAVTLNWWQSTLAAVLGGIGFWKMVNSLLKLLPTAEQKINFETSSRDSLRQQAKDAQEAYNASLARERVAQDRWNEESIAREAERKENIKMQTQLQSRSLYLEYRAEKAEEEVERLKKVEAKCGILEQKCDALEDEALKLRSILGQVYPQGLENLQKLLTQNEDGKVKEKTE